jgi:hypothetical protein
MGKSVTDAGGAIVEVLASRSDKPTVRGDLETWVSGNLLPVTSVIDSPPGVAKTTLTFFGGFGTRETCVVVDVRTMKIVKKVSGSVFGTGDSSVKQLIPEILKLLATG